MLRPLRYLFFWILPISAFASIYLNGWWSFLALGVAFGVIPALELVLSPDASNVDATEEKKRLDNIVYDFVLYSAVPAQWGFVFYFLYSASTVQWTTIEIAGNITALGLMCGVAGINVAHELGHRNTRIERLMAQSLLLTSFYMHFFIEHNKGHHRYVATPQDPSSARYREPLYTFWLRAVATGWISAWEIQKVELKANKKSFLSFSNTMLIFQVIQVLGIVLLFLFYPTSVAIYYVAGAVMGFLLLETVNYIEHYGLQRKKLTDTLYEKTKPIHSWNSDHLMGRLLLFELSRHSDHHYAPQRKYQILKHFDHSPQMPTGYPGMMLLSLIPPLFFNIMDQELKKQQLEFH
jgi:alkane 1-monooxygenase